MNYYIDFDNTIFDTVSFHNDLIKILLDHKITQDYIDNYYKENGIKPLDLVNHLCNEEITKDVDKLFKKANKYLYEDAIDFLKTKSFNNYILYTYGDIEYQNKKIDNCGILEYFDEIIITDDLKTNIKLDYENGIFIDDNTKVIKELLDKGVNKIYRIKRSNNIHSEEKLNDNRIIEIYSMKDINLD